MTDQQRKLNWRNAKATVLVVALAVLGFSIANDLRSDQKDNYGRLYNSRLRREPVEPKVPWIVIKEEPQAQPATPVSGEPSIAEIPGSVPVPTQLAQTTPSASPDGYTYEAAQPFDDAETIAPSPDSKPLLRDGSTRERVSITGGAGGVQLQVSRRDEMARVLETR